MIRLGCPEELPLKQREKLHELVDLLPESEVEQAERILEGLRAAGADPFLQSLLQAPEDDEIPTPEEDEGARLAREEYRRGEARPWEEVRKELMGG